MKNAIVKILLLIIIVCFCFNSFGCVKETYDAYLSDNNEIHYNDVVYNKIDWLNNEYVLVGTGVYLGNIQYFEEGKEYEGFMHVSEKDLDKNIIKLNTDFYLKQGFDLIDKYNATITNVKINDISNKFNEDIILLRGLTLNDILDKGNKVERLDVSAPYYFIDFYVDEYEYLKIYEVLRVYNNEIYVNLTPSRDSIERYNYPIKAEYKNYFEKILEDANLKN